MSWSNQIADHGFDVHVYLEMYVTSYLKLNMI